MQIRLFYRFLEKPSITLPTITSVLFNNLSNSVSFPELLGRGKFARVQGLVVERVVIALHFIRGTQRRFSSKCFKTLF